MTVTFDSLRHFSVKKGLNNYHISETINGYQAGTMPIWTREEMEKTLPEAEYVGSIVAAVPGDYKVFNVFTSGKFSFAIAWEK